MSGMRVLCFWNSPVSSLPRCVLCGQGLEINGVGEDVGGRVETQGEPGISDLHCCSDTKLISSNTWQSNIVMSSLFWLAPDSFLLSLIHQTLTWELANHRAVSGALPGGSKLCIISSLFTIHDGMAVTIISKDRKMVCCSTVPGHRPSSCTFMA